MYTRRSLSLVLVPLVMWTLGCTSYKEIGIDQILDYEKIRVTTTASDRYELVLPGIYGDTIRGTAPRPRIPLDQVEKIEVKYTDALKTGGLVVGVLVAAAAAAYFICASDDTCLGGIGP